jgi:hypothetical protein
MMVLFGLVLVAGAGADLLIFEGVDSETITTGDLLDGASIAPVTNHTVEIPSLELIAWTGGEDQTINTTTTSLGINLDGSGDDSDAFDDGEVLHLSFSEPVIMNTLDFNLFDAGESFNVQFGTESMYVISYDDLANKSSDTFAFNTEVPAYTDIQFFTTGSDVIGLDGIDVSVIPEPASAALVIIGGLSVLMARRFL